VWVSERVIVAAIALFAIAGLVTQGLAIATGRDFVFGIVPGFNPVGTRNLQVWFGSVILISCAVAAVLAALQVRTHQAGSGVGWWIAAGFLALLSVERMASVSNLVLAARGTTPWHPELYLAVATGACALATLATAERVLPAQVRRRLTWSAVSFLTGAVAFGEAVGQVPDSVVARVAHVVLATAGRALELAGLAMFLVTVLGYARSGDAAIHSARPARWPSARSIGRSLGALIIIVLTASLAAAGARWWFGPQAEPAYRLLFVDFEGKPADLGLIVASVRLRARGGGAFRSEVQG